MSGRLTKALLACLFAHQGRCGDDGDAAHLIQSQASRDNDPYVLAAEAANCTCMKCHRHRLGYVGLAKTAAARPADFSLGNLGHMDLSALPERARTLLEGLPSSERKVFSQFGEDGVIEHIFRTVGTTDKYYVEFGVQTGVECNTRLLRERHGWSGLMMDGGSMNKSTNLMQEMIFTNNIVGLFQKYGVPSTDFDLLSVDIDMTDFWVTREILSKGYRPRVIINEYNSGLELRPPRAVSVPPSAQPGSWDKTRWFGASLSAFSALYKKYGYSMVFCTKEGVNCFGVRDDVLGVRLSDVLSDEEVYSSAKYGPTPNHEGHPADPKERQYEDVAPYLV